MNYARISIDSRTSDLFICFNPLAEWLILQEWSRSVVSAFLRSYHTDGRLGGSLRFGCDSVANGTQTSGLESKRRPCSWVVSTRADVGRAPMAKQQERADKPCGVASYDLHAADVAAGLRKNCCLLSVKVLRHPGLAFSQAASVLMNAQQRLCVYWALAVQQAIVVKGCIHLLLQVRDLQALPDGGTCHLEIDSMDLSDVEQVATFLHSLLAGNLPQEWRPPLVQACPVPAALAASASIHDSVANATVSAGSGHHHTLSLLLTRAIRDAATSPAQPVAWDPVRVVLTQCGRELFSTQMVPAALGPGQARLVLDLSDLPLTSQGALVVAVMAGSESKATESSHTGAAVNATATDESVLALAPALATAVTVAPGYPLALLTVPVMDSAACCELQQFVEDEQAAYVEESGGGAPGSTGVALQCMAYMQGCHGLCSDLGQCLSQPELVPQEIAIAALENLADNSLAECARQVLQALASAGRLAGLPPGDLPRSASGARVADWAQYVLSARGPYDEGPLPGSGSDDSSSGDGPWSHAGGEEQPRSQQGTWFQQGAWFQQLRRRRLHAGAGAAGVAQQLAAAEAARSSAIPAPRDSASSIHAISTMVQRHLPHLSRQLERTPALWAAVVGYSNAGLERRYVEFHAQVAWRMDRFVPWCLLVMHGGILATALFTKGMQTSELVDCAAMLVIDVSLVLASSFWGQGLYKRHRATLAMAHYFSVAAIFWYSGWAALDVPGLNLWQGQRFAWVHWSLFVPSLWRLRPLTAGLCTAAVAAPVMALPAWLAFPSLAYMASMCVAAMVISVLGDWPMRRRFATSIVDDSDDGGKDIAIESLVGLGPRAILDLRRGQARPIG